MARDFHVNGEVMVYVKGRADSAIGSLTQLGLPADPVRVSPEFRHREINLDAWGGEVPVDVQCMLAAVNVSMNLIHFDRDVIDVCLMESLGGMPAVGTMRRAGARLGNGLPRFAGGGVNGNHLVGLNLASPV